METSVWWLILCVNVTRLRDAQIAGTILFLGVFVRVLLEGVSIWIRRLSKNSSSRMWLGVIGPEQSEGVEEGWTCSFCSELRHHPLLSLPTGKRGSQPFGLGLVLTQLTPRSAGLGQTGTFTISCSGLRPSHTDWVTPLAFLVLQLAGSRPWHFLAWTMDIMSSGVL